MINQKFLDDLAKDNQILTKVYTIKECAKLLNWPESVIKESIKSGKLPTIDTNTKNTRIEAIMFFGFICSFANTFRDKGHSIEMVAQAINADIETTRNIIEKWNIADNILKPNNNKIIH